MHIYVDLGIHTFHANLLESQSIHENESMNDVEIEVLVSIQATFAKLT